MDRTPASTAPALVTEVHHRNCLAAVRDLGRAGVPVVAAASKHRSAGQVSRYATASVLTPEPATDPTGHLQAVVAAVRDSPQTVVYPGTEMSLDACLPPDGSAGVSPLRLPYPSTEPLRLLRDKTALAALATDAGLVSPELRYAGPLAGAGVALATPCIVKPARPTHHGLQAHVVRTAADLQRLVEEGFGEVPVMAQSIAEGPLMSIAVVVDDDGRVRAEFHHLGLRLWPAESGSSSRAVGVAPRPEVTQAVVRMLRTAGYAGLAQVDYVSSPQGPVVLDVNPRYYGSMPLATASGVNLPQVWHATVCGAPYRPPDTYSTGVVFRWLEADLSDARHGDWQALRPPRRPTVGAVWSLRDPLPSAVVAAEAVNRVVAARWGAARALPQP